MCFNFCRVNICVGEYIVCGQYVADYSTTECRTFRPKDLRQLRTKPPTFVGFADQQPSAKVSPNENLHKTLGV